MEVNPESLAVLTPLYAVVVGLLFAVLMEHIPPLARWWDGVENQNKTAIRGWVGLLIAVLIALGHYYGLYLLPGIDEVVTFMGILIFVVSWVFFVLASEAVYKSFEKYFPRKNDIKAFSNPTRLLADETAKDCCEG